MSAAPASEARSLPWDWYPGTIPEGVVIDESAYIETTFSFLLYRSELPVGVRIGKASSTYLGTMFDVGRRGQVAVGEFSLLHGARIMCDSSVTIGDHVLLSWNVMLMDTYRASTDPAKRRRALERAAAGADAIDRIPDDDAPARPIRIDDNVWVGFDVCVLPGVTIGEGSIVGAKSVVLESIPPYTIAAGNPARVIRPIPTHDSRDTVARAREAAIADAATRTIL